MTADVTGYAASNVTDAMRWYARTCICMRICLYLCMYIRNRAARHGVGVSSGPVYNPPSLGPQ